MLSKPFEFRRVLGIALLLLVQFHPMDTVKAEKGQVRSAPTQRNNSQKTLATIRGEIDAATINRKIIPADQLNGDKRVVLTRPITDVELLQTAVAIINYESLVNQMNGEAPDPAKVAKPCQVLTNGTNNLIVGGRYSRCIVKLDTQAFANIIFEDCVIEYQGNDTSLKNVRFENCAFIFNVASKPQMSPSSEKLIFALLKVPSQSSVKLGVGG